MNVHHSDDYMIDCTRSDKAKDGDSSSPSYVSLVVATTSPTSTC